MSVRSGKGRQAGGGARGETFVAIDFETADRDADSACAVALVRVERGVIIDRDVRLIRPPRRTFVWTHIHGLSWADVADAPSFGEVWAELVPLLEGADFLAAHNAPFDRRVLRACCAAVGVQPPSLPWLCTVQLARRTWHQRQASLPVVCERLGIPLEHHDPSSDAEACARIVLAARAEDAALLDSMLG